MKQHFNKSIGFYGESLACTILKSNGYKLLERNFSCKFGEIDIIALKDHILCFIEVKTRTSSKYGFPCESINYYKQKKLGRLAQFYVIKKGLTNHFLRFDALEIFLNSIDNNYDFNLIENAIYF
ncbi:YraN family protein [Clostridium frigidicarnis]|uniref:UPF0102 protein SAMN04488528_102349 n=1 Tax=Clostridium frigidicarnis TaxID=84698 RepID=A0A1I0ZQM6_9CLOT|nr:YraN family protein [Clostridium frigidicarnis]SFB27416.1 putative endonuclease [Clostridium frigidicarnis]